MDTLGRYQLVEKLGQGGMGVVYRAYDTLLQRTVAVKLIGASIESNPELRERFFREARSAGQLSHRNIITIHDLGEHEGQPYLAMEFLEGEDLQHRLLRGEPMSLPRKLEVALEICEGLEYAHARGVIHRDIKPANIFITATGTAKILDFGLARLVTSELTNSNMMMGTLNYMAPEQVRGERADHRSDIFSVGVVLYELLGGRKAFEGDSFAATLYKILQEVPAPLLKIDATLPPELVAVVERALMKARDERYQQMSDMLRDLIVYRQRLIVESPAFGRPVSGPPRMPSDVPRPAREDPPAADFPTLPQDAPTLPPTPLPAPAASHTGTAAAAASGDPASALPARPRWRSPVAMGAAGAIILLTAALLWMITGQASRETASAPAADETALSATKQAAAGAAVQQAAQAFQSGDYAAAQHHAEAALAHDPDDIEARRLLDRARETAESVTRGIASARALLDAGHHEEASRAAGDVLSIDPANAEAKRIMEEGAERSRGRGADEARTRMAQAKSAATAAGAPSLAAPAYAAATALEREAQRLYTARRLAEATGRFYEASALFRSAETAAQTETVARAERARLAQAGRQISPEQPVVPPPSGGAAAAPKAPPQPENPPPPPPAGVERGLPSGSLPSMPAPVPVAPAVTPPAPSGAMPQDVSVPAASDTGGVKELLGRYEAALEGRSLDALKRLWPTLDGSQEAAIRNEFQHSSRIDVDIVDPRITVSGAAATVTFTRHYQLLTTDNQRLRTETRTTMTLRRTGSGWVIEQIRFEPTR